MVAVRRVVHTFTGTVDECDRHFTAICRSYAPAGYGTEVSRRTNNGDGTFTILIGRYDSCD